MSEINNWLEANYPKEKFTPGFDRIKRAVKLFGLYCEKSIVITVGGTNGKGSVSNLLYKNIKAQSKSVAVFCSPHLLSITERFQFSKLLVSEKSLLHIFKDIHSSLKIADLDLSFYEFTLICFLSLCDRESIKYIVLEVGIGGRLDATSVIDADVGIITSISRDHTDLLGRRYSQILIEKLGIAKKKTKIFASFELDYLVSKSKDFLFKNDIKFQIVRDNNDIKSRNEFLIKSSLNYLGLEISIVELPIVESKNGYIYSCCHNLSAVRNLCNSLLKNPSKISNSLILLSYSHRDIKELEYMSKLFLRLKPFVEDICLTHIDQFKAASVDDLKTLSQKLDITFIDKENLINVVNQNKKIYLSGSNYFIGSFINNFS